MSWYVDPIICQGKSYSCFKDCFIVLSNKADCPNYEITCSKFFYLDDLTFYYTWYIAFNTANKDTLLPGNKSECFYSTQPTPGMFLNYLIL